MSGGTFDYIQYRFTEVYEYIQSLIEKNDQPKIVDEYGFHQKKYSPATIDEFKKAVDSIKTAQVYIQRIDWLLSGDDNEDTFHKRLIEDLKKI